MSGSSKGTRGDSPDDTDEWGRPFDDESELEVDDVDEDEADEDDRPVDWRESEPEQWWVP